MIRSRTHTSRIRTSGSHTSRAPGRRLLGAWLPRPGGCPRSGARPRSVSRVVVGCLLGLVLGASTGLADTLRVDGRVTDSAGAPLAEARVVLEPLDSDAEEARRSFEGTPTPAVAETTSDAAGRFVLEAPEFGFYRVRVERAGYGPRFFELNPLLDHQSLPTVKLGDAEALKVIVRNAAGAPIRARLALEQVQEETRFQRFFAGLDWNLAGQRTMTSDEGQATLAIENGSARWRLEVAADGHLAEERKLGAGASTVRISLSTGAPLPVQVLDPSGDSVAGALIGSADRVLPLARTDDQGVAQVPVTGAAVSELWALAPDGRSGRVAVPADREAEETLELPLRPLFQVAGQVREEDTRQPIGGALVWIDGEVSQGFTRSDGAGHYVLGSRVAEGSVKAAAVGFTDEDSSFSNPRAEPGTTLDGPTVELAPSCWISGRVVDGDGVGVAEVEIHLELSWQGRKFADLLAFRTDAEGGFRSARLPGKMGLLLRAEAEGFAAAKLDLGTLEPGDRREGLEIVVRPGSRGFGWVVDDSDQPVVGAVVRLTEEASGDRRFFLQDPDAVPTFTTNGEGRFVIPDLVAGRYDLEAKASGHAPMTVRGIEIPEAAAEVDLGTLVLAPGVGLEGRVVDTSGQPVADAQVVSSAVGQMDRQRMMLMLGRAEIETLSGRDGHFVIEDRAAGESLEILVRKEGFVPAATGSVELPSREPLRIVLRPASRVLGHVLDGDRRPIAEATVAAFPEGLDGRARRLAPNATTGEDGSFEVFGVEPGRVDVVAEAPGFQSIRLTGLEVPADGPLENLELILTTGAVLSGTVMDAQGDPASGAMVFLMGNNRGSRKFTQTDGDGRYRLDGLEVGSTMMRVMLSSGPSVNKAVNIEPGENTVDVEVVDGVEVRGRVIGAGGEPVEGAFIEVRSQTGQPFFQRESVVSKAGGAFTIERVPTGSYVFRAQREGMAPGESEVTEVGDVPLDGVEIVLSSGQAIVGRVLGLEPELLSGVSIRVGRRWEGVVRPDYEGRFRIDELAPGDYTVVAEVADNSRRLEERVTVEEGVAETQVDLEFGDGYQVTGTIFHGDGPLSNAEVELDGRDVDYESAEVISSHDGRFRFADVPAGIHRLTVRGRDTAVTHSEEVEVRGDEDLQIDIVSGLLAGRVVDDSGSPIDSARLRLDRTDPGARTSQWEQSDSRGIFRFASVGEGNWRLEASRAGYRTLVEELELTAGEAREDLELRLAPAVGLTLDLRSPVGAPPAFVYASFVDVTGRAVAQDSFPADSEGRVLIDVVPEGSWRMILAVSGYARVDTPVTVPGDPQEVTLELEARLKISIPDLEENPALGRLRLTGPRGVHPWLGQQTALEEERELNRPVLEVDGLSPGLWSATFTTEDGRAFSGQIQAVVGATTALELR